MKTRTEIHKFTQKDIEKVCKEIARSRIVGSIFFGEFHQQEVRSTS